MIHPTARMLALLEILQGGGTHRVAHLAERLGVDERTIRRYAGHLQELEVPVESVRGRYGGYRLAPGFRMPPLMLTDDEALAVLLGLAAAGAADSAGERGGAAGTAAAKVRRVLPARLADQLTALFAATDFTRPARGAPTPEAAVMLQLAEATRQHRPAEIGYLDRAGRASVRTLHPYGIVAHSGRWYVTGLDSASGEQRTFRLDRIERVRIAGGSFAVPAGFRAGDAVLAGLARAPWRHEVTVVVRGTAGQVRAALPDGLATVDDDGDGWALVRLRAERLDWLPVLLAGLDRPFVVREPAELREAVREWAARVGRCATAASPAEADAAWAATDR